MRCRFSAMVPKSVRIPAMLLLLTLAALGPRLAAQTKPQNSAETCAKFGEAFQSGNDLVAIESYRLTVSGLVGLEDFKQLDCIADSIRSNKTRFAGGLWQLRTFYRGTSEIQGHATEDDWRTTINHLQKWTSSNPKSITARVALADAYIQFAWHARGDGFSDSVTESGWKLFQERIDQGRKILEDASSLSTRCPEWYYAMLLIARAQGWDVAKAAQLLKQAIAVEPDYYYNYRAFAITILPKWQGEDGDASRFAEESANRVGGTRGDILYFQIATGVVCACTEPEFNRFSWPRLQKGYEALEKQYGSSMIVLNEYALMATKNGDSITADAAFRRIGDNVDLEDWVTQDFFNQMKTWASAFAPAEAHSREIMKESDANLQSAEGPQYQKRITQALATALHDCAKGADDRSPFEVMLQVSAEGVAQDAWMPHPTGVGNCILKTLYDSSVKKQALFAPPPHANYWIKLDLDPGVSVATK